MKLKLLKECLLSTPAFKIVGNIRWHPINLLTEKPKLIFLTSKGSVGLRKKTILLVIWEEKIDI